MTFGQRDLNKTNKYYPLVRNAVLRADLKTFKMVLSLK